MIISVILKIILYVLLAVIGILLLLLALRIGFSVKVNGQSKRIFVHAGFLKIDAARFAAKKRKGRIKKQSLAKYLEQKQKNDGMKDVTPNGNTSEPQKNVPECAADVKNTVKTENNEKSAENFVTSGAKIQNEQPKSKTAENKTAENKTQNDFKSFLESFCRLPVCDMLALIRDTLSELKEPFGKYARLKIRKLDIVISTPDAANTAVAYGTASLAYQTLTEVCGQFKFFIIKRKNCGVYYDFSKTQSAVLCDIKFTMAVWQIILCLLPVIKSYFRFRKISQKERNV